MRPNLKYGINDFLCNFPLTFLLLLLLLLFLLMLFSIKRSLESICKISYLKQEAINPLFVFYYFELGKTQVQYIMA
jgi:multisubunit Na+/H+ antiporter MnhE subunit